MSVYIYPYQSVSNSHRRLTKAMNIGTLTKREIKDKIKSEPYSTVINWGNSRAFFPSFKKCRIFNSPKNVSKVINKLTFFNLVRNSEPHGPRIPRYTTGVSDAKAFVNTEGPIIARQTLTGHSGKGIVYCSGEDSLPAAPLYVEYINKTKEFRVHFVKGRAPFVQRKMKRRSTLVDFLIWNHKKGYIYASNPDNIKEIPDDVLTQAEKAFAISELDFGAVDVIWDDKNKKAYVLEVNTAPGLQGQTLQYYAEGLTNLINSI